MFRQHGGIYATVIEETISTILEYKFTGSDASLSDTKNQNSLKIHGLALFGSWMNSLGIYNGGGFAITEKPLPEVLFEKSIELWVSMLHDETNNQCPGKGLV